MKKIIIGLIFSVGLSCVAVGQQQSGTPFQIRVLTDAQGYLVLSGAAQTLPLSQPQVFANTRLQTDSSGNLLVVVGGAISPTTITCNGSTGTIAQFLIGGNPCSWSNTLTKTALGTTSTDGFVLTNTTAAIVGTTIQISPRSKWCGTAYNSVSTLSEIDCFITEVLPNTAAGATTATWKLESSVNSGAFGNLLTIRSDGTGNYSGNFSTSGTSDANGFEFNSAARSFLTSSADGLFNILYSNHINGVQINEGTAAPTLTSCGTGAVTAHSSNTAGEVTATGATTCTVTFGAPNFTNQPFCTIEDESTIATTRISAISVSAFTVAGLTSGDKFMFHCLGGI